jgi:hypothetical protein
MSSPYQDYLSTPAETMVQEVEATTYRDPRQVIVDGVSMEQRLPTPSSGLRSVVIPRAPQNPSVGCYGPNNPHIPRTVIIDPEMTGGRFRVDMSKVNPDNMSNASQAVLSKGGSMRDSIAATFAQFAEGAIPQPPPPQPAAFTSQSVQPVASPDANSYKSASFGAPPAVQLAQSLTTEVTPPSPTSVLVSTLTQPAAPPCLPPAVEVKVELATGHEFNTLFHDVIATSDGLILVYDHQWPTQMVWFPHEDLDQHGNPIPLTILVAAHGITPMTVYQAYPLLSPFRHGRYEYCQLSIDKAKIIEQGV